MHESREWYLLDIRSFCNGESRHFSFIIVENDEEMRD